VGLSALTHLAPVDEQIPADAIVAREGPTVEDTVATNAVESEAAPSEAAALDGELETDEVAQEALEPWRSVTPPSVYAEAASGNRFALIERVGERRIDGGVVAVIEVAVIIFEVEA